MTKHLTSSSCRECYGEGHKVLDLPDGRRYMVPCICQRERKIEKQLPPLYRQARLEDFQPSQVEQVTDWLASPHTGLLLYGPPGTGKTHLAAAIVRKRIEAGRPAIFRPAYRLYQVIRESYQQRLSEENALSEYVNSSLLVLDDLGSGKLGDHERRFTLEVLDRRLSELKPTVVTTNWSLKQIRDLMDERIASRLSGFLFIAFAGRDRRQSD